MRTVFMHVDAVYFFAVDIAAGVWTFLYHQTSLSGFMSLMGKHGSEQAAAYNQVIVWFHSFLALFLSSYKATQLLPVIVPRFDKNSRFTCNRLVFIRPARKKEPVRFILPLLCAIFAPDTNVMN